MSTVIDIESAVESLSDQDLQQFSSWFEEFINRKWDAQMEHDAQNGALDFLGEEARQARANGTARAFP